MFIGVNLRNTAPAAIPSAEKFGITYPSIMDTNDGSVQLACL